MLYVIIGEDCPNSLDRKVKKPRMAQWSFNCRRTKAPSPRA